MCGAFSSPPGSCSGCQTANRRVAARLLANAAARGGERIRFSKWTSDQASHLRSFHCNIMLNLLCHHIIQLICNLKKNNASFTTVTLLHYYVAEKVVNYLLRDYSATIVWKTASVFS